MRLDNFLSEKYNISRNKAQFCIKKGGVKVNDLIITKSGFLVSKNDIAYLLSLDDIKYVARSAFKLKGFLEQNNLIVNDFVCVDVGASTGGFTQILIEKGAKKIYTIDVGTLQLHDIVKNNKKVISFENTDIRDFDKNQIIENIDLIVVDVSFISLSLIIDSILNLKTENTKILLLFKPQYEVGKANLTKKGVPINNKIIEKKINDFYLILEKKGVKVNLAAKSILKGENGNSEYFILI